MLDRIIAYSIEHKLIVLLFSVGIISFGIFSLSNLPIGAVPDVTNNQVQIITTSRNLATEDVERFLTYPVELEMANLPGVKEIRSVSKFGLSVVTVVFEDQLGTYLPRQLIEEKLKTAQERIPEGFGTPFLGPISTGLGEIYQYVIDVDPEYVDQYSLTDLRTVQDWIIKRQLSGIPGVVEVNTWGGKLKQYEVAINASELRALKVSVSDVYEALKNNNGVVGGGYIEKLDQAYFVRGEGLVTSIEDIESIVVDVHDHTPVYVRDIAEVHFGYATRFGAITGNGQGEKILGQVMMLKGANSNAVITSVKERVAEIQSTLPPGIRINGFLERSELIGKTTRTIAENLILGCLIVIFVVIILLGNFRSGLVVASVIPMSLLFALGMMYLFDVDANLMSMGAIDFGIIIDGAVIIVEYITYRIAQQHVQLRDLSAADRQAAIDQISISGAGKMMHSAIFGQLIIIIVFIPVLSLVGVEGKMFRPMALVFSFALIGAIVLCLTYVPVMASLFIKPAATDKNTLAKRMITSLQRVYTPALAVALTRKKMVLGLSIVLLAVTGWIFSRMGGEFIPTLDEGDFVIQPVLKTGTSLTKTIEMTTQMEKILLEFPEVQQVVTRIGAAEVPTDPMSMEESDVIIKLAPKAQWVTATTKDGLATSFKEALQEIPGVTFEFTQPIEMRFNELITGVRADIAIKIFGEDLDILASKAAEVEKAIANVEGASDIVVEKITGLPQMTVKYDRSKIAKYGFNVSELNTLIETGFAGKTAGVVFEGEKQFDLVLRFDRMQQKNLKDLRNASVTLENGTILPLSEFATIQYSEGPAKISRDDTKRRIVVGVNVRDRDLESVVTEIQQILNKEITLPTGYTVRYGGQFENLENAIDRLLVAVPVALILIFVLLYFAFSSLRQALIIYSAIPLAAVGGVLLLYVRGMPFSISAGIGFIALFGIAVLNGIVLIEELNELNTQGMSDMKERILTGTRKRMRPVLLTATAAILGFLPMAVSTSAGAEVQRPLATVVIGGLISATILTLFVLPVLYSIFDKKKLSVKGVLSVLIIFIMVLMPRDHGFAQSTRIDVQEAVDIALQNNRLLEASDLRVTQSEQMIRSSFDLDKTYLFYSYDENNLAFNMEPLNVYGFSQSIRFPTLYGAKKKSLVGASILANDQLKLDQRKVTMEVTVAYFEVVYWQELLKNYTFLDSLLQRFSDAASQKFKAGESNYLEKLTAEAKHQEISTQLSQVQENITRAKIALKKWMQTDVDYQVEAEEMVRLSLSPLDSVEHPGFQYYSDAVDLAKINAKVAQQELYPDIQFSLFNGSNQGEVNYWGVEAGLAVPLWFGSYKSKVAAAKTNTMILQAEEDNYQIQIKARYQELLAEVRKYEKGINYYHESGQQLSEQLILHAGTAFQNGEIDFLQYVQLVESAKTIEKNYLVSLFEYNKAVLMANYILK